MKKSTTICLISIIVLSLLTLLGMISAADTEKGLDYSDPSSAVKIDISASELVSLLTKDEISKAESEFLDSAYKNPFSYTDLIPSSLVSASYTDNTTLSVTARDYSYTSRDGYSVIFVPTSVAIGDKILSLSFDDATNTYTAALENTDHTLEAIVRVNYTSVIHPEKEISDQYINAAYYLALDVKARSDAYDILLAGYNDEVLAYQKYTDEMTEYKKALLLFEKYKEDKKAYESKLAEYNLALDEYNRYKAEMDKYEDYLEELESYNKQLAAYKKYVSDHTKYTQNKKKYEAYINSLTKYRVAMATMENVFLVSESGHCMVNTLNGDTVDTVVAHKDELVNAGKANPDDIENANTATLRLRELLKGYRHITKENEKYAYYSLHYAEIRDNFKLLFNSLYSLFNNTAVKEALTAYNRFDRYVEFVCHLYVLSTGFDDTRLRNSDFYLEGSYNLATGKLNRYYFYDVLEECQIPEDTNSADPSKTGSWPTVVEEPVKPKAVKNPGNPPAEVLHPGDAPIVPAKPTEPEVVLEPVCPDEVKAPSDPPVKPVFTALEKALLSALLSSELKMRDLSDEYTVEISSYTEKYVAAEEECVVSFYSYDGKTLIDRYILTYGEEIVYNGKTPAREENAQYRYTFKGWVDENGNEAVFGAAQSESVSYFAVFDYYVKQYTVTFIVDGASVSMQYDYGSTPSFGATPTKPSNEKYHYSFASWDKDITTVTSDAIYTAVFDSTLRSYVITFNVDGRIYERTVPFGSVPSFDESTEKSPDSFYLYTFKGFDKELSEVTEDTEYTAIYEKSALSSIDGVPVEVISSGNEYSVTADSTVTLDKILELAKKHGLSIKIKFTNGTLEIPSFVAEEMAKIGSVSISLSKKNENRYLASITSSDGSMITLSSEITLKISNDSYISSSTKVYLEKEDDSHQAVSFSQNASEITLKLKGTSAFVLVNEYRVTLPSLDSALISCGSSVYTENSKLTLELLIDEGYYLKEIYAIGNITNTRYELDGLTLTMPCEDITILCEVDIKEYTVIFISDGKEISKKTYKHGDTVEIPPSPTKDPVGEYVYTFFGWDKEVTSALDDAVYTAIFNESILSSDDDYTISPDRFIGFAITVISVFVLFVGGIIFLIVYLKKRKKKGNA